MKILFTGITGLLGSYFLEEKRKKHSISGTYSSNKVDYAGVDLFKLNVRNKKKVLELIKKIRPQVVVHAASIGNVDYCEKHSKEAHEVNVEGTKNVLEGCINVGAKIIFISSNAVYNGKKPPYNEKSTKIPLDVYGKTKQKAEEAVINSGVPYIIIRLMTMYGWQPKGARVNPATWVIEQLTNKNPIKVVEDIYNNHLWAGQAADVLWKIIEKNKNEEIYNVAGSDCISRYELALKVADVFSLDASLISPVKNSFFKSLAPRPKNSCFDTTKIRNKLGIKPFSVAEGLKEMKNGKKA